MGGRREWGIHVEHTRTSTGREVWPTLRAGFRMAGTSDGWDASLFVESRRTRRA